MIIRAMIIIEKKYSRFFQVDNFNGNLFIEVLIKPDKQQHQLSV